MADCRVGRHAAVLSGGVAPWFESLRHRIRPYWFGQLTGANMEFDHCVPAGCDVKTQTGPA